MHQRKAAPPLRMADLLSGKMVLITDASSGLGLEAAKYFARMKSARLILACRSMERGKKAAEGTLFSNFAPDVSGRLVSFYSDQE